MNFHICGNPLRSLIERSRENGYFWLGIAICRGDLNWEDSLRESILELDTLYWAINNAHGVVTLAGVESSEFPRQGVSLDEIVF